jgi:lysyl-tRNA synthetase, class II
MSSGFAVRRWIALGVATVAAALLLLAGVSMLWGSAYGQGIAEASVALLLVSGRAVLTMRTGRFGESDARQLGYDLAAARAIVESHGEDSISPFIVRPDKHFHFEAGGVLAYRVIGRTAVISGDPVGPEHAVPEVLASFRTLAKARGWHLAVYGASAQHAARYETMGLRVLCAGEEAVVDPARFTLDGRAVRKLRQSGHRVKRHGWEITVFDGRDIDRGLEAEIDALERAWRATKSRIIGFAMGMGVSEGGVQPGDLYVLGRAADGELRAVMRFISHRGKLSLDTMRRVGETPNGLNEALLCRALEIARERQVPEVSLNYAGLAHLVRNPPPGNALTRKAVRAGIWLLGRHFQMERLVRFNDKFTPSWRPRYLVYESRLALPRTVLGVLEAEGYIAPPRRRRPRAVDGLGHAWGQPLPRGQQPAASPEGHVSR